MFRKHFGIPYGILVVCLSGAFQNIYHYFVARSPDPYMDGLFKDVSTFGFFIGVVTGLFIDKVNLKAGFVLSAVLTLLSYLTLSYVSADHILSDHYAKVAALALFFAGQGASLALIGAISANFRNFQINTCFIVSALLISYLRIALNLETHVRVHLFGKESL